MIRMTVREGGTVRSVRLAGARVEIGSDPSAGLRLAAPGVSPRHCVLRGLRRGFEVLDRDSREGTILDGTRVSRAAVRAGSVLTLGSASLVLEELTLEGAPLLPAPGEPLRDLPFLHPRAGAPRPPEPFEIQLYRAVRRSPPVLASVGIHAAAALLALLLVPPAAAAPRVPASIAIAADRTVERERDAAPLPEAEALPFEREPVRDPPEAPPPPEDDRLLPPPPRDLLPPDSLRRPDFDAAVISIGAKRAKEPEKAVAFEGNPSFDADGSGDANRRAAGLVLGGLGGEGGGDRALLRRLDARKVLVVRGTYDRVEDTLALLGIRHDTLTPEEVAVAPLPPDAILVVDCDADPLPPDACRAVRAFVHSGGYLCTTDWGLENVLEKSFPGILRSLARDGAGLSTQNEVVKMRVSAPGHALVRGIRAVSDDAAWWVEDQAHPVEVVDRERVTVLAESAEFRKRYRSGVLAATFGFGKGKVLHLLGHAWQKEGNLKGTYALQRMILNFLVDRAGTLE